MSKHMVTKYFCDRCGKSLPGEQHINIVTRLSEGPVWSRFHVQIIRKSGIHNDAEQNPADLCKRCTLDVLQDAISRILQGERVSKGVEQIEALGWEVSKHG